MNRSHARHEFDPAGVSILAKAKVLRPSEHLGHVVDTESEIVRPPLSDVREALAGDVDNALPSDQPSRKVQVGRDNTGHHDIGRTPGHAANVPPVRGVRLIVLLL